MVEETDQATSSEDIKSKINQKVEEIKRRSQAGSSGSDSKSLEDFLETLLLNEDFSKELNNILSIYQKSEEMDGERLENSILLFFRRYMDISKVKFNKKITKLNKNLAVEEALMQGAKELALTIKNRDKLERDSAAPGVQKSENNLENATSNSKADFKRLVKYIAVYQMYKVLSPKRIAGETKEENFAHNVIIGGIEKAMKYEGGSQSEIASYSKELLGKIQAKEIQIKKSKGMIR